MGMKGASSKGQSFTSKDEVRFITIRKMFAKIVEQFKNNFSQSKIAKKVGISPYTIQIIIMWFR